MIGTLGPDATAPGATVPIDVVLVAAGSGQRLGRGLPKAFVSLGGRSLLSWSLRPLRDLTGLGAVAIVVPADRLEESRDVARDVLAGVDADLRVVPGGATRQASVAAGLDALPAGDGRVILVHDAARAFTPTGQFAMVAAEVVATAGGVVPALPVIDTLKRVSGDGEVLAAVDRSELVAAQTPQGFPGAVLRDAYARAGAEHTDDAALAAAAGHPVRVVGGHARARKITTPADLEIARRWAGEADVAAGAVVPRVGVGVDAHAFEGAEPSGPDRAARTLWLAGLAWPGERALAGHSDGDVVAHAIGDALLGAAGLGDLGAVLGTDDPSLDGAHGDRLLGRVVALIAEAGYEILSVSVQLVSSAPRIGSRRAEAEAVLSGWVGAPVALAATTSDGLGFTGRGEGAWAVAVASIA